MMLVPYEGLFGRAEVEKCVSCLRRRLVQSSIARWITGVGRPWVICVVTKAQRPYCTGKYREMLRELPIYQESCSSFVSLTTVSSRADEDVFECPRSYSIDGINLLKSLCTGVYSHHPNLRFLR